MADRTRSNSSSNHNLLSQILSAARLGIQNTPQLEFSRMPYSGFSRTSQIDSTNFLMRSANVHQINLRSFLHQIHEDAVLERSGSHALVPDERSSQISMHSSDFHGVSYLNHNQNILENSYNNNLAVHNHLTFHSGLILINELRLTTNTPEPSPFASLNYSDLVMGSAHEIDALNKNDTCPISLASTYEIKQPTFIQGCKEIYEFADLLEAMQISAKNPTNRAPVEVSQLRKVNPNDIPAPTE